MTDASESHDGTETNRRRILKGMAAATAAGLGVAGTASGEDVEPQLCCCPEVQCCTSACNEFCVGCPCGVYSCEPV